MLLYPDPRIGEQPDNLTTCFAAPIEQCDWEYLRAKARPEKLNGLPFIILKDGLYFMRSTGENGYDELAIILRDTYGDADECLESAAWIRVKYQFNGMIYICRLSTTADHWQSYAAIAAAGVDGSFVAMVDFETDTENL